MSERSEGIEREGRVIAAGDQDTVLTAAHIRATCQVEPVFVQIPGRAQKHLVFV